MGKHKKSRDRSRSRSPHNSSSGKHRHKKKSKKKHSRRDSSSDSSDQEDRNRMSFEEELQKIKEEKRLTFTIDTFDGFLSPLIIQYTIPVIQISSGNVRAHKNFGR